MELTFIDVALNILEMFFCMEFIMWLAPPWIFLPLPVVLINICIYLYEI